MPNKIYIAITIALVAFTAVVTARIVGSGGSADAHRDLSFRVSEQCNWWARELEEAARAYEENARSPVDHPDLPFGTTHFERLIAAGRIASELKFCWSVRKRETPNVGSADIDNAGADFRATGSDPNKLAHAMRRLADAAKRNAALDIGP